MTDQGSWHGDGVLLRRAGKAWKLGFSVSVFDEAAAEPFPLRQDHYELDWSLIDPADLPRLKVHFWPEEAANEPEHLPPPVEGALRPAVYTHSWGGPMRNNRILLKFRHAWTPKDLEAPEAAPSPPVLVICHFRVVVIDLPHYIETPFGEEVTLAEAMHRRHGGRPGVLLGDIESVLRVPPVAFGLARPWSEEEVNLLAQLFAVVRQIGASEWRLSTAKYLDVQGEVGPVEMPKLHDLRSVAMLFRQLTEEDLLARGVKLIKRAMRGSEKETWIQYELDTFRRCLAEPVLGIPSAVEGQSFLEAFNYGYRLFHIRPQKDGEAKLHGLLDEVGPARFVFALHGIYTELFRCASKVVAAAHPDLQRWIADGLIPNPTLRHLEDLIGS